MQKKYLLLIVAIASVAVLLFSAGILLAQDNNSYPLIIQKLSERFKLDPAKVTEVFEEVREARKDERDKSFEERLETAVENNDLTEAQKNSILEKRKEEQKKLEEWRGLAPEERREKMKAYREEIKSWAEANKVPLRFLMGAGFGMRPGLRGGPAANPGEDCGSGSGFGRKPGF